MELFLFEDKYVPIENIINSGVSGDNTQNVIARLTPIVNSDSDLAIIMLGTNNFLNVTKLTSISQFIADMTTIVNAIKNANRKVIITSIFPCWAPYLTSLYTYPQGYGDLNAKVVDVNSHISTLATTLNVGFFDMHKIFSDNGDPKLTIDSYIRNQYNVGVDDGWHLTVTGYDRVGFELSKYIKRFYRKSRKAICVGDSNTRGGAYLAGAGTADITAETYPGRLHFYLN